MPSRCGAVRKRARLIPLRSLVRIQLPQPPEACAGRPRAESSGKRRRAERLKRCESKGQRSDPDGEKTETAGETAPSSSRNAQADARCVRQSSWGSCPPFNASRRSAPARLDDGQAPREIATRETVIKGVGSRERGRHQFIHAQPVNSQQAQRNGYEAGAIQCGREFQLSTNP